MKNKFEKRALLIMLVAAVGLSALFALLQMQ